MQLKQCSERQILTSQVSSSAVPAPASNVTSAACLYPVALHAGKVLGLLGNRKLQDPLCHHKCTNITDIV